MGRVLQSNTLRGIAPIATKECPVCGNEYSTIMCPTCHAYHAPDKCEGADCKVCAELKFLKEQRITLVGKKENPV